MPDSPALIAARQILLDASIAGRLLLNINVLIAVLRGLTEKMAKVIVTFNIMPENPDVDLAKIESDAEEKIAEFAGEDFNPESDLKITVVAVAFGLKALDVKVILDEDKGSTDKLEEDLKGIENVKSVEVTDVRRIIG